MTEENKWPPDAQWYMPLKTDRTVPTLFYRKHVVLRNDGTYHTGLQYLSTCGGGWQGSNHSGEGQDEWINNNLVKIEP